MDAESINLKFIITASSVDESDERRVRIGNMFIITFHQGI